MPRISHTSHPFPPKVKRTNQWVHFNIKLLSIVEVGVNAILVEHYLRYTLVKQLEVLRPAGVQYTHTLQECAIQVLTHEAWLIEFYG